MNQAVLVISGYNIRAVVAFCRWATAHDVKFHIIAKSKEDPIFLTDYKDYVGYIRDSTQLRHEQFRTWVDSLCHEHGYHRIIILPSTEYLNRFLLENRNFIESENCIIPLVDERLYKNISDKYSFAKLCNAYGLDIPAEFNRIPEQLPFVAKPRANYSAEGNQHIIHLIHNSQDLENFSSNYEENDYFFQQFIYGRSFYLLAYIGKGGLNNNVFFSQENLMQQAKGGSIILAKHSKFHHNEIAKHYVTMLRDQNFFGFVMIEVRLDESNGQYYMIEANPRLWGPLQFCIDNNIDLLGAMLKDYEFEIFQKLMPCNPTTHYFWSGGLTQQSQPIAYHSYTSDEFVKDFSLLKTQDIFLRKDTLNLYLKESKDKDAYEYFTFN